MQAGDVLEALATVVMIADHVETHGSNAAPTDTVAFWLNRPDEDTDCGMGRMRARTIAAHVYRFLATMNCLQVD